MYDENSFKNYIFWIKVKRGFFMFIFSIVGAAIGMLTSQFVIEVLLFSSIFRVLIVTLSTLLFFSISLLVTANTGKEVQDGYWKIAVLRKLTIISKKLDDITFQPPIEVIKTNVNDVLNETIKESLEEDSSTKIKPSLTSKKRKSKKVEIANIDDI